MLNHKIAIQLKITFLLFLVFELQNYHNYKIAHFVLDFYQTHGNITLFALGILPSPKVTGLVAR